MRRYEPVVRLEFAPGADPSIREMLRQRFGLSPLDVYDLPGEVDYTSLFQIASLPIAAAAADRQTVAVKMTAYRVGGDTPFVKSLMKAAEAGKQVVCVIEIKARFDEEQNLHWAAELERVGAHVTFGVQGLKTHAKLALVVRQEASGLRSYVHIGTGNYHVRTARLYADFGVFTSNPAIARDVVSLFHHLTGRSEAPVCSTVLAAPSTMRPRLIELIRRETASSGVPVDLIMRGFCCLRPGVPGRSDGIRVRSIIGRFLEHSRIFHFAAAKEDPLQSDFFIGSADWMHRNLSKRVEVVTPILGAEPKARLWEVLDICLRDRRQAWVLGEDGGYSQLRPDGATEGPEARGTHEMLMELARRRSE
jgi:polyphosphate kinase